MSNKNPRQIENENKKREALKLFQDPDYDPLAFIPSEAQHYVRIKTTTTTLSDKDIAKMLNVSIERVRSWKKNDHVINYAYLCKKDSHDQEFLKRVKRQNQQILDKTYNELMSRFEAPPTIGLASDATDEQRKMERERYAHNARFIDIVKAYDVIGKQARNDLPEDVSSDDQEKKDIEKVREQYNLKITKRVRQEEILKNSGFDSSKSMHENLSMMEDLEERGMTFDIVDGRPVLVESKKKDKPEYASYEETIEFEIESVGMKRSGRKEQIVEDDEDDEL